jgi:hypothetical protein
MAKEGDEFSLTVKEPARFRGAKIKGHLSNIKSTSVGDELYLNFDMILLTDGTGFLFPGKMEAKGGAEAKAARNAASREGAILGIVSPREKPAGAAGVTGALSYVKIEKGTEIIMTPVGAGPP